MQSWLCGPLAICLVDHWNRLSHMGVVHHAQVIEIIIRYNFLKILRKNFLSYSGKIRYVCVMHCKGAIRALARALQSRR